MESRKRSLRMMMPLIKNNKICYALTTDSRLCNHLTGHARANCRGGGKPKIQTRLEGFFMTPIITGPANFDVLIVDSMGKPNHKVAENITKPIKTKMPGTSVNCTSSKKIQQKDENNCSPLTIFNIENLLHSSRPKITDVHILSSTQINAIRQRCHNHAYLTIKGYNEYNNQVSASEKILEEYIYVCSFCPPLIGLLVLSP